MNKTKNIWGAFCVFFSYLIFSATALSQSSFNLADAFAVTKNSVPSRLERLLLPTPVPVQVSVANTNWVTTFSICNTSGNPIPLKSLEFKFKFAQTFSSTIWGQPWADWKVVAQNGSDVTLSGGTPFTPDLPSDPNCVLPLTIQFSASPTTPLPTGPFEFKAEGGPVVETGTLQVSLSTAPVGGLSNPMVTVTGPGTSQQQAVTWGTSWTLANLAPGNYTVSGSTITNGGQSYTVTPVSVMVNAQQTASAVLTYKASTTSGQVKVTLVNPPTAQVAVTFTGNTQTINQNVTNNATLTLPADTYAVTSNIAGFTATANPNPLTVPTQNALTITYTPNTSAAGKRTINFVNQCPFPVWFGFISGATGTRGGGACKTDADCYQGSTCVDRGAGGTQCFWKTPVPTDNNFRLNPNGGTNSIQLPIYNDGQGAIYSGAVAGRTNCTAAGCETADCGAGVGACPAGRGFGQPATQAEFTFGKTSPDFYNTEIINGMNLPVEMAPILATPNTSPYNCGAASGRTAQNGMGACTWDMNPPSNDYVWVRRGGAACTTDGQCTGGNKCGLSFNPGQTPSLKKTCGVQLGYWTANQICGMSANYGAPFNCQQALPAPQQDLKWNNLYGCTKVGSCYQPGATTRCCGCVNWDKVGTQVPPGPVTQQCVNANPNWTSGVLPKLTWIKKGCPSIYTHPFDDMSSTFICQIMKDNNGARVNSVDYTITFCPGGATGSVNHGALSPNKA
ncbi:MAG: hypothetical protein H0W64_00610 [Gammaproteobacteria bacterium]|nr:hypothetical protein [Gammaproteobacteria bacterium]